MIHVLIDIVDEELGRPKGTSKSLIHFVKDRPGHDKRYAIDATKIKNELGWEPSLQSEEGLRLTVQWYLANEAWMENVTSGNYQKYYDKMYADRV